MPTKSKKARSEAAKKAARTRARNESAEATKRTKAARKAARTRAARTSVPLPDEAKTETKGDITIVTRPERKTGEVEVSRRKAPDRNEIAPAPRATANKAKVLPVKEQKGGKEQTVQALGFAPGAQVTVHHDRNELRADRAPFSTPLAKGKVANDGTVKLKLSPGFYVLVGKVEENQPGGLGVGDVKVTRWQYSGFTV